MSPAAAKPNALASYMAKRAGVEPTSNNPQLSVLGDKVVSSLGEMAEMAKARMATHTLKDLMGEEKEDPIKHVAGVMSVARDIAGIEESRSKSVREELAAERQRRQELEERQMKSAAQGESSTAQMMMMFFNMQRESDRQWQERLERIQSEHREEMRRMEEKLEQRAKQTERKPSEFEDMAKQALLEKLQPSDPLDQINWAKNLVGAITPQSSGENHQLEMLRYQHDLAVRQSESEMQLKREEMQHKLSVEDRKARSIEKIASALSPLFTALTGNRPQPQPVGAQGISPQQQAPQPTSQQEPQPQPPSGPMHVYYCSECKKEYMTKRYFKDPPCPVCKSDLEYVEEREPDGE